MRDTPTAETMRFDGHHPALELVNTIYGQVGGPVEHDVLSAPADLVVLASRLGLVDPAAPAAPRALRAARALRTGLDPLLRARLGGDPPPQHALDALQAAAHAAHAAARLLPAPDGGLRWSWPADDPLTPVHRLALAAADLLTDGAELARLRQCAACCWLYLDHSRGAGRRWCSMADCGTEAKKRRYVQRRRERRSTP